MLKKLLFAQCAVVAVLAAVHILALSNDLYWIFPWLDLTTHFLGGIWGALFFYWIGALLARPAGVIFIIGGVVVLGVAWEVFELSVGISAGAGYALDTFSDLFMDVAGALTVLVLMRFSPRLRAHR